MSGIKTLIFPTDDLATAKRTFTQLLGVEPSSDEPYYLGFTVDGIDIGFDPTGHQSGLTGPVAYLEVDDIRASVQVLVEAGGTAQGDVRDVGGGRQIVVVHDAESNAVGLLQDS